MNDDQELSPSSSRNTLESPLLLNISGMTCTDCSSSLERHLRKHPAVTSSQVVYVTHKAAIQYDASRATVAELLKYIEQLGFSAEVINGNSTSTLTLEFPHSIGFSELEVDDMQDRLRAVVGVSEVSFDKNLISIEYEPSLIGARALIAHLHSHGYEATVASKSLTHNSAEDVEMMRWRRNLWLSACCGIPAILLSFILPQISTVKRGLDYNFVLGFPTGVLIMFLLALPMQFVVGWPLYISAYKSVVYGKKANMDTLVMLSTTLAFVYSVVAVIISVADGRESHDKTFFETCVILLALITAGRYMEFVAKRKASSILTHLEDMQAPTAILLHSGAGSVEEEVIDKLLIERGDILKILPGSRIPTDGVVVFGTSTVDESLVTGEAVPVYKKIGDGVFGGTSNQLGVIHIKASKMVSENTLASIHHLVEEAQAAKPNAQRLADNIAGYFTPVVLSLGVLIFIIWYALAKSGTVHSTSPFGFALTFAITVLVISCPCAFGLAVPTAVMVATSVAATKCGIMFKGGDVVEKTHKINTVVFDKTGTLTKGRPHVISYEIFKKSLSVVEFFSLVGSAEADSEHVIAKALVEYARNVINPPTQQQQAQNINIMVGQGLSCSVGERHVVVANREGMSSLKIDVPGDIEHDARTIVYVAVDNTLVGVIKLADELREETRTVIAGLRANGIDVKIVSGDTKEVVEMIAQQAGIRRENALGGISPAGKVEAIRALQSSGKIVAMVGDGINDSAAIAQADVGFAVGSGTNITLMAADVVLVGDKLEGILRAIEISKKTFSRIKLNFAWAIGYNLISIPLGAGVFYALSGYALPPALAGLSELLSSVPVIIFSMLLQRYTPTM